MVVVGGGGGGGLGRMGKGGLGGVQGMKGHQPRPLLQDFTLWGPQQGGNSCDS